MDVHTDENTNVKAIGSGLSSDPRVTRTLLMHLSMDVGSTRRGGIGLHRVLSTILAASTMFLTVPGSRDHVSMRIGKYRAISYLLQVGYKEGNEGIEGVGVVLGQQNDKALLGIIPIVSEPQCLRHAVSVRPPHALYL